MNLQQSMAIKRAGNNGNSSVAGTAQRITNKNNGGPGGKAPGSSSVDKTVSQF